MASVKIKLDSGGMKALLNSAEIRAELTTRAERVMSAAQGGAPVESGEYQRSIAVVQDTTDRAVARVTSTAPHGIIVETATGNLSRALDSAG